MNNEIIEGRFNLNPKNDLAFGSEALISLNPNSYCFNMRKVNESLDRIMKNSQFYWTYYNKDVKNTNNVRLILFTNDQSNAEKSIAEFINETHNFKPDDYEYTSLIYHIRDDIEDDKYKNNFWWDIENDFMMFFGTEDRKTEFLSCMQNERELYDKEQRTFICVKPPFQKNRCNCATFDADDGWGCEVTGDRCMYFRPSAISCAKTWGEGPLASYYL